MLFCMVSTRNRGVFNNHVFHQSWELDDSLKTGKIDIFYHCLSCSLKVGRPDLPGSMVWILSAIPMSTGLKPGLQAHGTLHKSRGLERFRFMSCSFIL